MKATKAQCERVLTKVDAQFGPGAKLVMDFDWFGDGPNPAIVWEEGPYEWAIMLDWWDDNEVWCEPGTSWFVNIYAHAAAHTDPST